MNRCCRSGGDVGARAASVGKGWANAVHLSMPCPHGPQDGARSAGRVHIVTAWRCGARVVVSAFLCCVTTRTCRHTEPSGNGMLPERPCRRRHCGGRPGDQGSPAYGPVAGSALRRRAGCHAMAGMLHHRRGVRGAPIMSVWTREELARTGSLPPGHGRCSFDTHRGTPARDTLGPRRGAMQALSGVRIIRTGDVRWRATGRTARCGALRRVVLERVAVRHDGDSPGVGAFGRPRAGRAGHGREPAEGGGQRRDCQPAARIATVNREFLQCRPEA